MRFFIIAISFLFVTTVYADVTQQSEKIFIEHVTTPELYVFCNQKSSTIILDRVGFESAGVQAGWSSSLPSHMCSIFLTDKSPFVFACTLESSGGLKAIDCKEVLLVSRLPWGGQTQNHQAMMGSYWIVENATPDELIIMLRRKNIDT